MLKEVWKEVTQIFRFLKRTKMGKKWGGVDQCPACLKSVYPLNRVRSKLPLAVVGVCLLDQESWYQVDLP